MSRFAALFDIDGTLIRTGGAGAVALDRALETLTGIREGMSRIRSAGKTDPLIVAEIFETARPGEPLPGETLQAVLDRYVQNLAEELERAPEFRVMPGLPQLLETLVEDERAVVGLCTGNVEPGGRVKLRRGGLNDFFPFGGFATDHPVRAELTKIAVRKACEHAKEEIPAERVFVIGDTPHDISAARAAGVRVIAVATGPHPREELAPHNPDFLVEDMADVAKILEIFGGCA